MVRATHPEKIYDTSADWNCNQSSSTILWSAWLRERHALRGDVILVLRPSVYTIHAYVFVVTVECVMLWLSLIYDYELQLMLAILIWWLTLAILIALFDDLSFSSTLVASVAILRSLQSQSQGHSQGGQGVAQPPSWVGGPLSGPDNQLSLPLHQPYCWTTRCCSTAWLERQ